MPHAHAETMVCGFRPETLEPTPGAWPAMGSRPVGHGLAVAEGDGGDELVKQEARLVFAEE